MSFVIFFYLNKEVIIWMLVPQAYSWMGEVFSASRLCLMTVSAADANDDSNDDDAAAAAVAVGSIRPRYPVM